MYKCWHCEDLHFAAHQARACWDLGNAWEPGFEEAASRRVHLSWKKKMEYRRGHRPGPAERELIRLLAGVIHRKQMWSEWWLPGHDYRVDCLIEIPRLVSEVDGPSHRGMEGQDRYRSMKMREDHYEVLRVTNEDVLERGHEIAAQVAFRVSTALAAQPADPRAA